MGQLNPKEDLKITHCTSSIQRSSDQGTVLRECIAGQLYSFADICVADHTL